MHADGVIDAAQVPVEDQIVADFATKN